ncbi:MAG TPA: molybdate ABC transporter substrate-binding protein [Clostridia bacterium]|nr:molybdate ABC transporter substrate-binding protein [Clostridia bacterium]
MKRKKLLPIFLLIAFIISITFSSAYAKSEKSVTLTISAAASMTDVMKDISNMYKKEKPNVTINFNFGSSGSLQKQIEQGAPADVFISAGVKQMNILRSEKLVISETVKNLVLNDAVLIVNKKPSVHVKGFKDLVNDDVKVIALGEPKSVPSGQYAEQIFNYYKILDKVKAKAVYGKDVREVLTWVEQGNADAGVVYKTDAMSSNKVKIVEIAANDTHSPILYPAGVVSASKNISAAKDFMKFITGAKAKAIYKKYGFRTMLK